MSEEAKPDMGKITQKIIGWEVKNTDKDKDTVDSTMLALHAATSIANKPTKLERGDVLHGSTYKIKQPPLPEAYKHGFYMTINNITVDSKLVPYEILIDTKNSECWPMLNVLSLTLTTLFRCQLSITHLLEEYRTIQDGTGGYRGKLKHWQEKPKWYKSILGEIADVIEYHISTINQLNDTVDSLSETGTNFIAVLEKPDIDVPNFPSTQKIQSLSICPECSDDAMVLCDGCLTCTSCGYSKCG